MSSSAWFGVLGSLEVAAAGRPIAVPGRRQREVLAVLLLHANRVVTVDTLVEAAWPDGSPATARRQAQNCVGRLRRTLTDGGLPPDVLQTRPGGYVLQATDAEVDALTFARLVAEGRRLAAEHRWPEAATSLRAALNLWRGDPLADLDSHLVTGETRRLRELRLTVLEECLELELNLGRHHEITAELAALVHDHPLRERLWAHLMLAPHRAGRTAEAMAACRRARELYASELGLDVGPELRALEHAILLDDRILDLPSARGERALRPHQGCQER